MERHDIREHYPIYLRYGFVGALTLHICLFLFLPQEFRVRPYELRRSVEVIMEELPPELEKLAEPPPVERPKLPVAAETPEEVEASTIETTELHEIIRRPTEIEVPVVPFWKVEVKPVPIFLPEPEYPEICRHAGIEGVVIVNALVDVDGSIMAVNLVKSSGNEALDEAAIAGAWMAKFNPARQRDQFVRVWVSIPYRFRLHER